MAGRDIACFNPQDMAGFRPDRRDAKRRADRHDALPHGQSVAWRGVDLETQLTRPTDPHDAHRQLAKMTFAHCHEWQCRSGHIKVWL